MSNTTTQRGFFAALGSFFGGFFRAIGNFFVEVGRGIGNLFVWGWNQAKTNIGVTMMVLGTFVSGIIAFSWSFLPMNTPVWVLDGMAWLGNSMMFVAVTGVLVTVAIGLWNAGYRTYKKMSDVSTNGQPSLAVERV